MNARIGFLGFGEAASAIAGGIWRDHRLHAVAYDVVLSTPDRAGALLDRAAAVGVTLLESTARLAEAADLILSAVVASRAADAAASIAPHLGPAHLYADLNSVAPATKVRVHECVTARGARCVDLAVMQAVARHAQGVPMLAAGKAADELRARLEPLGFRIEVVGEEIGQAAAIKMFRSILVKGMEALFLECLEAASTYEVEDRVLVSLQESMPGMDWIGQAAYLTGRTAAHGDRRVAELREVAATLRDLEIEPIMAEAAAARLHASAPRLARRYRAHPPATPEEAVRVFRKGARP